MGIAGIGKANVFIPREINVTGHSIKLGKYIFFVFRDQISHLVIRESIGTPEHLYYLNPTEGYDLRIKLIRSLTHQAKTCNIPAEQITPAQMQGLFVEAIGHTATELIKDKLQ